MAVNVKVSHVSPAGHWNAARNRPVEWATYGVIATGVLHVLDHIFNQPGRHIDVEVFVSAGLGWIAVLGTLYLARRGHRLAPILAVVTGTASAAGFLASHVVPEFSVFSDSFIGLGVNALSWLLVAASICAGFVLAGVGAWQLLHGSAPARSDTADANPLSPV